MNDNQKELYLRILDQFPNPIWRAGLDGKCDFFNRGWLEFTGRTIEQEMGNGWAEGVHPDELEKCVSDYMGYFKERKPFLLKYRLKHNDGTYHWLLDYGNPFFDNDNNFLGYIGSCYDANEVESSKNLLNLTGEIAKVGGWEIDIVNNKLNWTDQVYKIHEVSDDFQPKVDEAINFYVDESKDKITQAVNAATKDGIPFDLNLKIKTAKGNILDVRSLGKPIFENGKVVKVFGTFQDITEVNKISLELEKQNTLLKSIFDHAPIGFAVNKMSTGEATILNNQFEDIYGVDRGSLTGIGNYFETVYLDPVFREEIKKRVMDDIGSGDPSRMKWENIPITTKNGEKKFVTSINIPVPEQDLMISTVQDVTKQNLEEEELLKAQEILKNKIQELESFNRVTVNREMTMIELKNKISELEEKLKEKENE